MNGILTRLGTALADRYRLERELGQGGMATVYLAQDLRHDRKVALKVLKPELAAVLGGERFVVEIKTTASLQHPHILPLFDSGSADGFVFYVMPYIEGETLRDKLRRETQLSIEQAVRIASEVADALDYAHRRGIIHRDIKPENILLHDGRPMVADFGIARAVSAAAGGRMTETGISLGTPYYMSPEQATAEKEVTPRSDIYSLGCVLYEMLSGSPPHVGATAQQIVMKIVTDTARPVTELRKLVPPHVAAALGKALERLPADRFETAKEFRDALGNPTFATTAGLSLTTGAAGSRGVSKQAFGLTAAAAGIALIAAAWGWSRSAPAPEVSRLSIDLPADLTLSFDRGSRRVALSRDGRKLAFLAARPGGLTQIYLRHLDRLDAEPVPGTEGAFNPEFSPDGNRIAFVGGSPRAIKVVSLGGGTPAVLTDSLVDLGGISWGSDGYIYYDGHFEGDGLARIRETGGKPEIATRPADATESWHSQPSVLPNGRGVLFSIARGRGASPFDVGLLDTRSGTHRVLLRGVQARYSQSGHLLYVAESGSLMAIRFDPEKLTTSGEAVAVVDGLSLRTLGRSDVEISDGGTLLYAAGASIGRDRELMWASRNGTLSQVDSAWRRPLRGLPALSPDGRFVAQAVENGSRFELWVKELDRGPASKLVDAGVTPAWSPDGKQIAYFATGGVFVGPADGSVLPQLRYPNPNTFVNLEFSPEGKWIVGTEAGDIIAIRTSGDSTPVRLVSGPALERRSTISPNGNWLAYESDEGGRSQIYVRPFPETQRSRRQVSVEGGSFPRWSRDGRELFFINEANELIAVPMSTTTGAISFGVQRVLFSAAFAFPQMFFDPHPDGTRFLVSQPLGGVREAADKLVIVQNFFEVLRAKLP